MNPDRYSVRVGESCCLGEDLSYEQLLQRIVEFTVRAAVARSIDETQWEHEELRRKGFEALQIFKNRKAIWDDDAMFQTELLEARREHVGQRFESTNELDVSFYDRLDNDLRARWRHAGYETACLRRDMKPLFKELERDAAERADKAREGLLGDVLRAQAQESP